MECIFTPNMGFLLDMSACILLDMARKGTTGLRVDFFPTGGSLASNRGRGPFYLGPVEVGVTRGHFLCLGGLYSVLAGLQVVIIRIRG